MAARSDRAPVRERWRRRRHPHHDEVRADGPRVVLRDDARVRARALRAPGRARARPHAARRRRLARHARVAEPHVGEPRRPQPPVLALLLPAAPGTVLAAAGRRRRGDVVPRGQHRAAVADPDRRRRDHLQHAHHPPLRARAGPARRERRGARPAERVEPPDGRVPRDRGPERRRRRAPGHALGDRDDRLLPDLLARQRDERPDLGADQGRPPGPRRQARARRVRAAPRVARRAHPQARPQVQRRRKRSSARSARASTPSLTSHICARSTAPRRPRS